MTKMKKSSFVWILDRKHHQVQEEASNSLQRQNFHRSQQLCHTNPRPNNHKQISTKRSCLPMNFRVSFVIAIYISNQHAVRTTETFQSEPESSLTAETNTFPV